jgi:acyl-CoA reductase-like NAD-dependent aldehyde dehydrogenase
VPTTNPTSTTIFKALLCLKTRNSLVLCPHPRARKCTIAAARIVAEAAEAAGAPPGIVSWIENPSMLMSQALMRVRGGGRRRAPRPAAAAASVGARSGVGPPTAERG